MYIFVHVELFRTVSHITLCTKMAVGIQVLYVFRMIYVIPKIIKCKLYLVLDGLIVNDPLVALFS